MDFPTIALLTDFGERDGFVAVMKGVMLGKLNSPTPIVDISHQVEPQNIRQASWILSNAWPYFPTKTIFVCIVDPGVGNKEQASLLCYWPQREQIFIAPDNGLLTPIYEAAGQALKLYDIRTSPLYQNDELSVHGRSQTFHGRDVYAPIAALTANAMQSNQLEVFLGQFQAPATEAQPIHQHPASQAKTGDSLVLKGEIIYSDIFGNLITNIPHAWLPHGSVLQVQLGEQTPFICPFLQTYSGESTIPYTSKQLIAVPSSGGTVELAIFQGNARKSLNSNADEPITLQLLR